MCKFKGTEADTTREVDFTQRGTKVDIWKMSIKYGSTLMGRRHFLRGGVIDEEDIQRYLIKWKYCRYRHRVSDSNRGLSSLTPYIIT